MDITFITAELPLELWQRVLARIRDDYENLSAELADKLTPRQATVDHGQAAIDQVAETRADALQRITVLENLQLLALELDLQLQQAVFVAGVPDLARRVETLRTLEALYLGNFRGLPSRQAAEQGLADAVAQMHNLRNAGHGEQSNGERQRLRDVTHTLPVLGREDAARYMQAAREVRATCDELDARRQALMLNTRLAVQLPQALAAQLADYGVAVTLVEPASNEPTPVEPAAETQVAPVEA